MILSNFLDKLTIIINIDNEHSTNNHFIIFLCPLLPASNSYASLLQLIAFILSSILNFQFLQPSKPSSNWSLPLFSQNSCCWSTWVSLFCCLLQDLYWSDLVCPFRHPICEFSLRNLDTLRSFGSKLQFHHNFVELSEEVCCTLAWVDRIWIREWLLSLELIDFGFKKFNFIVFCLYFSQKSWEILLKIAELSWLFIFFSFDFVRDPLKLINSIVELSFQVLVDGSFSVKIILKLLIFSLCVLEVSKMLQALSLNKRIFTWSCSQACCNSGSFLSSFWLSSYLLLRSSAYWVFALAIPLTFSLSWLWE